MADNITLNPGIGGQSVATDDIGAHYQRSKLIHGKDGTNDGDVSKTNPFPVAIIPGDNPGVDAFGRFRTSQPFTIFDGKFVETDGSLFWDTALVGGGAATWTSAESTYTLTNGTASGDSVTRQTKEYFNYQPGKSQLIMMTGVMGAIKANVRQRIGYFDNNNGLFFEEDGTNLKVVRRTNTSGSPVDNTVNQASWNIDPMNGSGPSGITIDMSKTQIFVIDFEWLGVGRVRMGFVVNGIIYYCHQFLNANSLTLVYMARPSLPCRYEMTNTGVAASGTSMKQICSTVISEGGFNMPGVVRAVDTGSTAITVSSTLIPLLSIRLKSANIRSKLRTVLMHLEITNNQTMLWRLLWNAALTGPSWTSVSSTSVAEYDTTASAVSGGDALLAGYVTGNDSQDLNNLYSRLNVVSNIAGTSDILTIAAMSVGGSNSTACASMMFEEVY